MNLFAGLGFVAVAGAAVYFFAKPQPADDYVMPVQNAYAKLSSVKITPSSKDGMMFSLKTDVTGNGSDKVVWSAGGSMASFRCELGLAPVEKKPDQTHVTVNCNGGSASDGAAAGMVHNMMRNRVIEMVDATLNDRPFDAYRAKGETASRWPGDGVDGSLGTAVGEALKMDAQVRQMQMQSERDRASGHSDYRPADTTVPGEGITPRPTL